MACLRCNVLLRYSTDPFPCFKIKRKICLTGISFKIIPNNLKGKSKSSQDWLTRHINDPYVKKSRYENYRARSAFKLIEVDDKYNLLKPGMTVLDCGAAPGAWMQVAVKRVNADKKEYKPHGKVIALDLLRIEPIDGAIILQEADFTNPLTQQKLQELLDGDNVDIVLSDMAPNATGVRNLDQQRIITLAYSVLSFSVKVLSKGGNIFIKLWGSDMINQLESDMKKFFCMVKLVKPNASRSDSSETFILGRDFKGIKQNS